VRVEGVDAPNAPAGGGAPGGREKGRRRKDGDSQQRRKDTRVGTGQREQRIRREAPEWDVARGPHSRGLAGGARSGDAMRGTPRQAGALVVGADEGRRSRGPVFATEKLRSRAQARTGGTETIKRGLWSNRGSPFGSSGFASGDRWRDLMRGSHRRPRRDTPQSPPIVRRLRTPQIRTPCRFSSTRPSHKTQFLCPLSELGSSASLWPNQALCSSRTPRPVGARMRKGGRRSSVEPISGPLCGYS